MLATRLRCAVRLAEQGQQDLAELTGTETEREAGQSATGPSCRWHGVRSASAIVLGQRQGVAPEHRALAEPLGALSRELDHTQLARQAKPAGTVAPITLRALVKAVEPAARVRRRAVRRVRPARAVKVAAPVAGPAIRRSPPASSPGGSSSTGRKLLIDAHALISVPFTEKWSLERSHVTAGCTISRARKRDATSPTRRRSRLLVNTVASDTRSSIPRPTNQRNRRLNASCSIGWRSERIE